MPPRPPRPVRRLLARWLMLALVLLTTAGACRPEGEEPPVVRLGAGSTAEQQLLITLSAELLTRMEIAVEVIPELGDTSSVRHEALEGRIDGYWDYSGAAWTLGLGLSAPAVDPQESFEAVAAEDAGNGLRWLGPSGVDAALVFFVADAEAPEGQDANLSWLAGQLGAQDGALCADASYLTAPAGYAYLADTYAIATDSVTTIAADEGRAISAVIDGECLAGLAPATSGEARLGGLTPLSDDQDVFPAFVAAPIVVEGSPADLPPVVAALEQLAAALDTQTLSALNALVVDEEAIDDVASGYLDEIGLG
ncbi:MAG TPA: glycine betaine ABC transporter substrate-binding protein [Euzebya sp.]|nr:glycine betaine ABC transporter substrate-binding protein [Euzebya sp.]